MCDVLSANREADKLTDLRNLYSCHFEHPDLFDSCVPLTFTLSSNELSFVSLACRVSAARDLDTFIFLV